MDISFNCDKCGQSMVIDAAGAGLQVQCPKCSESLTVPYSKSPHGEPRPVPIAVQLRDLRKLTIADVLGDIGERAAVDWLGSQGYRVCRADVIEYIGHSLWIRDSLSECDCQRLTLLTGMCAQRPECGVPNVPCQNAASEFFTFNPTPPEFVPARASAQWTQFWNGYPGRIDFFGVKDGKPACFEVKANRGRLSRWQFIRLQWMKNQGFDA